MLVRRPSGASSDELVESDGLPCGELARGISMRIAAVTLEKTKAKYASLSPAHLRLLAKTQRHSESTFSPLATRGIFTGGFCVKRKADSQDGFSSNLLVYSKACHDPQRTYAITINL